MIKFIIKIIFYISVLWLTPLVASCAPRNVKDYPLIIPSQIKEYDENIAEKFKK